jgi:uncharacterized membrane protein YsdA (DUF1294 family)
MDPGPFLRDQPVSAVFALTKMHLQSACQNHAMPGNLSLHVSVLAYTIYIRNFGKEIFMNTRTMLILYFIVMNLIGLSAMVIDKIRAMERRFRIPESVLLIIAVLGGSIGCIAGMIVFRHKKRKVKFRIGLPLILILQIGAILALYISTSKIVFL